MRRGPPAPAGNPGRRTQGTRSAPHPPLGTIMHIADYQPLTGRLPAAELGDARIDQPPEEVGRDRPLR